MITKPIPVYPEGNSNVCTTFYANPSNILCWHISRETKHANLLIKLDVKSLRYVLWRLLSAQHFTPIHPIDVRENVEWKCWPASSFWWKFRRSTKQFGFIIWDTWISVQNLLAIHQIFVKMFHSWESVGWSKQLTDIAIPRDIIKYTLRANKHACAFLYRTLLPN